MLPLPRGRGLGRGLMANYGFLSGLGLSKRKFIRIVFSLALSLSKVDSTGSEQTMKLLCRYLALTYLNPQHEAEV